MADYSEWNDEKLLKEYRLGKDPRLVEILFLRYADVGFRVAMRFMRNEADAEDILQGAFIQFLRDLHQFREGVSVKPWLMKIIVNNCKDKCKEENRRLKREQKVVSERIMQREPESIDSKLEEEDIELKKKLRQSVDELPEKYRSPLWLVLYEEFSYREVSSVLSLPEKTIRTQVARALEKLKEKLAAFGAVISIPTIIELINKSSLEEAPASILKLIHSGKLVALSNQSFAMPLNKANSTSLIFEYKFIMIISFLSIVCISYYFASLNKNENIVKHEAVMEPEKNIIKNSKIKIYFDFNTKENIRDYAHLGEFKYLENGGIDNSGCLEITKGFSMKIPIKNIKLPLRITCRSNIKPMKTGIVGYTWLMHDNWEKMGHFYNISPYKVMKEMPVADYIAKNSKDWSTETFWITEKSIDEWINERRTNLYFVNQGKDSEYLFLLFYGCIKKVDDMKIESVEEAEVPDISRFEKINIEFDKNNESANDLLKRLMKEMKISGIEPGYINYSRNTKADVIMQIQTKIIH